MERLLNDILKSVSESGKKKLDIKAMDNFLKTPKLAAIKRLQNKWTEKKSYLISSKKLQN